MLNGPNDYWVHFFVSKGNGLAFLFNILSDVQGAALASFLILLLGAGLIWRLAARSSSAALTIGLVGVCLYLQFYAEQGAYAKGHIIRNTLVLYLILSFTRMICFPRAWRQAQPPVPRHRRCCNHPSVPTRYRSDTSTALDGNGSSCRLAERRRSKALVGLSRVGPRLDGVGVLVQLLRGRTARASLHAVGPEPLRRHRAIQSLGQSSPRVCRFSSGLHATRTARDRFGQGFHGHLDPTVALGTHPARDVEPGNHRLRGRLHRGLEF